MKFSNLKILTYNGKMVGLDGDLYFVYCHDQNSSVLIGNCDELKITIQSSNISDLFADFTDTLQAIISNISTQIDYRQWAKDNGYEIRDIPNLNWYKKGRYRLPIIYLIEVDTVEELESGIKY